MKLKQRFVITATKGTWLRPKSCFSMSATKPVYYIACSKSGHLFIFYKN